MFEKTVEQGFRKGLIALKYRYRNCRYGFEVFENPINGKIQMILPNRQIIDTKDIAERLFKHKDLNRMLKHKKRIGVRVKSFSN